MKYLWVCNVKDLEQFLRTSDDIHTNAMQIDDFKKFSRCLNLHGTKAVAKTLFLNQFNLSKKS